MERSGNGRKARTSLRSHSLLERLRSDDSGDTPARLNPVEAKVASIKANLIRLLNARRGGAAATPGYGLSDFNDASVGSSDMLRVIGQDIRHVIATYEPRVQNVRVEFEADRASGLELCFRVTAGTRISHTNEQVVIDLVLKEGRHFAPR